MKESSIGELMQRFGDHTRKAQDSAAVRDWEEALFHMDEARWCLGFLERATRRDADEAVDACAELMPSNNKWQLVQR